ncbi:MFS transporter [Pseudooceanicola nanhaiensis]|uniref:MFS transporter n=1 Tax=Pseudooceanicola nanhaiensis TaxID=375761 RepID=UPI001CD2606C|nr:MFS transporter [Pseudooceanicola nanhaiensis]MCA0919242.1 MFS transporter [Pseudooceanicola nanhaiensis]
MHTTAAQPTASDGASPATLILVALATCLALVVFTAPLTTLEAMTASLSLGAGQQAWVMSGMPLGSACGLLTAGALGDTLGRRRTFLAGLWITALSSIAAAMATGGTLLIVMRVVQGLGSAGIMACGLGLLGQAYSGAVLRRATAIWAAALGAGVAVGPLIASGLMALSGWQAAHWLIVVVSAALALAARGHLPDNPSSAEKVDVTGGILLIFGLASLLSALVELRVGTARLVGLLLALAMALLALFTLVERRARNPILTFGLFAYPRFSGATLAAFASGAGVLALMSMVPTVLVRGLGLPPVASATVLLAWSGVTVVAALGAVALPERITSRDRVVFSILGCAVGQLLMLCLDANQGWVSALPGLLVAGISNGILNASLGHEALATVPGHRAAMGSAANNTARYLGSALGIAMISILMAGDDGDALLHNWHVAVIATTGFSLAGAVAIWLLSRREIPSAA